MAACNIRDPGCDNICASLNPADED